LKDLELPILEIKKSNKILHSANKSKLDVKGTVVLTVDINPMMHTSKSHSYINTLDEVIIEPNTAKKVMLDRTDWQPDKP